MTVYTPPTAAETRAAAMAAADALYRAADAAADALALYAATAARTTLEQSKARALARALPETRLLARTAMAVLEPDSEACAYCGTRHGVAYVQRGDLYLCERCAASHRY